MARKVTLYIEDIEIKVLVARGNRVEKWASLTLDQGLVDQGLIMDQVRVAESIKQLFREQSITERAVTVGLSGLNSICRIINLPTVPRSLVAEAISNEASRVLPVPLSQVYYSYQPLTAAKGEMRYFLAAYPRQATDVLLGTLKKAGLKPDVLELAPLAMARTVDAPRVILVNAWLNFMDIVILVDRIPLVIRSFSLPVESASMQAKLTSITEEVNRTITFYNSSYPDKPLDNTTPINVGGDIARDEPGWEPLKALGFPVSVVKPDVQAKSDFSPATYIVNIGLALKGSAAGGKGSTSIIDFNALPQAYQPPSFSWVRVLIPVGLVVVAGLLYFSWVRINDIRQQNIVLRDQTSALQAATVKLNADNKAALDNIAARQKVADDLAPQIADIQKSAAAARDEAAFFNTTMDGFGKQLTLDRDSVKSATAVIPAGVLVSDIKYDTSGVTINGWAPSQSLMLAYGRALAAGQAFNSVVLSAVSVPADGQGLVFTYVLS